MGVQTSEVCYTSATTGRGDHEVHKGHVWHWKKKLYIYVTASVFLDNLDLKRRAKKQIQYVLQIYAEAFSNH
jgi:hypothetical protein